MFHIFPLKIYEEYVYLVNRLYIINKLLQAVCDTVSIII